MRRIEARYVRGKEKMNAMEKAYMTYRKFKFAIGRGIKRGEIVQDYMTSHTIKRLQLGCGEVQFEGWLNTDIYEGDVYVDITKDLPFEDESFDFIYTHHVIEHITFEEFRALLKEMRRILKPGGAIRIVTPGLEELHKTYKDIDDKKSDLWYKYRHASTFFNEIMRQDGEHKFIYDWKTMEELLVCAGFKKARLFKYGECGHAMFVGLDVSHRYADIADFSLCAEARG
jgi:predicted SAM-dependent methyltransferase